MAIVLRNGTVIDGTGRPPQVGADVTMDGRRLAEIGPAALLPAGAEVVDCSGRFILPGLVDSHVHLAFSADVDHPTTVRQVVTDSVETLALRAARNAQECLLAGITTVRDCGGRGLSNLAVRDAVAGGLVPGPRILASGAPFTTTYGHLYFCGLEVEGTDAMRTAARQTAKAGVDLFKVMVTGGIMTGNARPLIPQYSEAELEALCEEARRLAKPVAAHVGSAEGVRRCVAAGVNTIEHCGWSSPDGTTGYDPALAERMAAQGTSIGLTVAGVTRNVLLPSEGITETERQRQIENAYAAWEPQRAARAAGVRVMLSSDAGVRNTPFRDFYLSLVMYQRLMEVSPMETLIAATRVAAEGIGLGSEVGTLETGKRADVLVLDADPLTDLTNVRSVAQVYRDGRRVVEAGYLVM